MSCWSWVYHISKNKSEDNNDSEFEDINIEEECFITNIEEKTEEIQGKWFKSFKELLDFQSYFTDDYDNLNEKLVDWFKITKDTFDLDDEDVVIWIWALEEWAKENKELINEIYSNWDMIVVSYEMADWEFYIWWDKMKILLDALIKFNYNSII